MPTRTMFRLMALICFDIEGVLVRTFGSAMETEAFRIAAADAAGTANLVQLSEPESARAAALASGVAVAWLESVGVSADESARERFLSVAAGAYGHLSRSQNVSSVCVAGARHTLLSLSSRGHCVVAVSGSMRATGHSLLNAAEIGDLLCGDGFWGCSATGDLSDLLILAGQTFSTDPHDVWFVSSKPRHRNAARRACVNFLAVGTGGFGREDFEPLVPFAHSVGCGDALNAIP